MRICSHHIELGAISADSTISIALAEGIFKIVDCRHGKTIELSDTITSDLAKIYLIGEETAKHIRLEVGVRVERW